jgi:hypothetical protein
MEYAIFFMQSCMLTHITWKMNTLMRISETPPVLKFHGRSHPQKKLVILNPIHTDASEFLWMI